MFAKQAVEREGVAAGPRARAREREPQESEGCKGAACGTGVHDRSNREKHISKRLIHDHHDISSCAGFMIKIVI